VRAHESITSNRLWNCVVGWLLAVCARLLPSMCARLCSKATGRGDFAAECLAAVHTKQSPNLLRMRVQAALGCRSCRECKAGPPAMCQARLESRRITLRLMFLFLRRLFNSVRFFVSSAFK
jgi:hypothetical protein